MKPVEDTLLGDKYQQISNKADLKQEVIRGEIKGEISEGGGQR